MDMTVRGTATPDQCESGSNVNERVTSNKWMQFCVKHRIHHFLIFYDHY